MKKIPATLIILFALASCTAEPTTGATGTRAHREASTTDTATAPSGISFDMGDTTMQTEEETLHFIAEEWDEVTQDADI